MSDSHDQTAPSELRRVAADLTPTARPGGDLSTSFYDLDPLDTSRPPFPNGRGPREGSPDSNDQDNEYFITPANSARPSVTAFTTGDEAMPSGLGIGVEYPSDQAYHVERVTREEPTPAKSPRSKPPLVRSKSVEPPTQGQRATSKQTEWQATNVLPAGNSSVAASNISAGPSTSRCPIASSSALPHDTDVRERAVSPTAKRSLIDQQASYLPHNQYNSSSTPRQQPNPSDNALSPSKGDPFRPRIRNTPKEFPANVPTGFDFASSRMWQAGDSRTRTISAGEKGYAFSTKAASESGKFTDSQVYWLGLYFFFNLGLTLFNKFVLVSFPFPYVSFFGSE
jgi:hypothetical protein